MQKGVDLIDPGKIGHSNEQLLAKIDVVKFFAEVLLFFSFLERTVRNCLLACLLRSTKNDPRKVRITAVLDQTSDHMPILPHCCPEARSAIVFWAVKSR